MALTTAQAFAEFIDALSPTEPQRAGISAKRNATEDYLRAAFPGSSDMPIHRVILIGSAGRGTIVRPVDDIDVMAEFTNKANVWLGNGDGTFAAPQLLPAGPGAQLALAAGDGREEYEGRLELYKLGRPYRDREHEGYGGPG